jgi:glycosyltransferase involved in cell wall biosynthesis
MEKPNENILLVLLNKNEEKGLEFILPRINLRDFKKVICVDGGSTDGSIRLLNSYNVDILPQSAIGRGNAFKMAFDYSLNHQFEYLIFFSTDGNESVDDLKRFIYLTKSSPDLIIASRMKRGSHNEEDDNFFKPRKWGNNLFSITAWVLFSRKKSEYITDPINGYRAFKLDSWRNVKFRSSKFSIEFESSIKAYKLKFRTLEFETYEHKRIAGKSSATALKTSFQMVKTLFLEL